VTQPLLRHSRAQRGFAIATFALLGAAGFLPLFGGPTYEFSLAAGVVLPAAASMATAIDVARWRPQPWRAFAYGVESGFVLALIGFAVALLHGLRQGFCDPLPGIALYALGPGCGALLAGAWGGSAALLARRRAPSRRRTLAVLALAWGGPLLGIALSLVRFYTSPMVFAFDPFFGYFAGPLYDTVFDPLRELLTYRAGSALTLLGIGALFSRLSDDEGRLRWSSGPRVAALTLAGCALGGSAAVTLLGPELGHYSTSASIQRALGRRLESQRCTLHYSKRLLERDMQLLGRECDAHMRELERYFELHARARTTVYVFSSPDEKRAHMGAAHTQIAKPWRREIYIQADHYPHPVLRHELAHVIAGQFGRGPFAVAGPLGGWLPDPGRIEGIAVAAAPADDADLSAQGWAKAMLDLKILPPLSKVFRLTFLGENSATAYTVAGAFVAWFKDRYGTSALRRWYAGADLAEVAGGKDLAQLERDFHAALAKLKVEERAMLAARARFDRPAIFGRACPHAVDALEAEAGARISENDPKSARELLQDLLALDPEHHRARMALGLCSLRQGQFADARRRYEQLSRDPSLHRVLQAGALEALGDLELAAGNPARADEHYRAVLAVTFDEDHRRTLDVKRLATSEPAREAVQALLVGGVTYGASWDVAAIKLGQWIERQPERGVAAYLVGRNLYLRRRWQEAARYLDLALERELLPASVLESALRTRALVACAEGDARRARELYERFRVLPGLSATRSEGLARSVARCQRQEIATLSGHGRQMP
jgi:tetratricopeptide (TPR) repeat protein